jgi:anthranilate 1,2-dioxygenase (deaminating, decarboxylating) large subunit
MTVTEKVLHDRFHTSLYTDPKIFEAEITRIFENGWVWVAHESELPDNGTFKSTVIGRQPVIVTRDQTGAVNVMLNRCRHRAAAVCELESGKAARFMCPYHGWTYGLDGRLLAVPYDEGYGENLKKEHFPLYSVRAESYAGLWFASLDPDVEPLADFLGEAKHWIDLFLKQSVDWPLTVIGSHKFEFDGNWKVPLENTTDGYHLPVVHNSYLRFMESETADRLGQVMRDEALYCRGLGNGHSVGVFDTSAVDLEGPHQGETPLHYKELEKELLQTMPPETVARVLRGVGGVGFNLNLFPNVALSGAFFRELRPIAVDKTEVRHIALGMKGGPACANRARLRIHEQFQGPAGLGSSDDREAWERVARGARSGRDAWVMLNRGLNREHIIDGRPVSHATDETGMREVYARWKKVMADAC